MANRADWAERVGAWRASGLTAAEFSRGKGYAPKSLSWWSNHLKQLERKEQSGVAVPMARVVRDDGARELVVEIGTLRVVVRPGFDAALLREVLRVAQDAK
jgi:hypothetical protein